MFKLIPRYLASSFIIPFVVSTLFFVSFLLVFQMFRITKLVINKDVPVTMIIDIMLNVSVSFLPMAIPLSTLFATIYTLGKISADSEFIVMRSIGFSREKLLIPFLMVGVLIAITTFSLNETIVPYAKGEFRKSISYLTSTGVLSDIKKGQFYSQIPDVTLFAEDVENKGKILKDVFIHINGDNNEQIIFAKEGVLSKEGGEELNGIAIRLKLSKGSIIKFFENKKDTEKTLFDEYDFPVAQGELSIGVVGVKDSMRSSKELRRLLELPPNKRPMAPKYFVKTQLEYWSRINTPLLILVFIVIGFALGVQGTRGKGRNSAVLTLLILVGYYTLFFTGIGLARNQQLDASLAVFLPTLLTLIVGIYFYQKQRWV